MIRDAHALKNLDPLLELLAPPQKSSELMSVCIFLSKDLDGRKKFSKVLLEKAAVVPCEEVVEAQREAWVYYLAKRRGLEVDSHLVAGLCTLDPWSLDSIDQELEKFSIAGSAEAVLEGTGFTGGTEVFLESFFTRDLKTALPWVSQFANHPDISLPLLGLMSWNVRQLALWVADRENGTRSCKLNPYLADRFHRWGAFWKLSEVLELQHQLTEVDFSLKQRPLVPLGVWTALVTDQIKL